MEQMTELSVESGGERLDRFVSDHVPGLSRATVQRLVEEGHITVDGRRRKASYRVQCEEVVQIYVPPPAPTAAQPENIPLEIIYEDADLLVINKPAGMVVHPAAGHTSGTLVNAVLGHTPTLDIGGEERPGIVHRLDADTSGLIVVAKSDKAMLYLQAQFKARTVHKTYLALVIGHINPPRGRIEAPIARDPAHRQKMAVVTSGKSREAITVYRSLASLDGYTLVAAEPQTGRTHQIRVHLAFIGFPVAGDTLYGQPKNKIHLSRQFLHAWKISFALPDGRPVSFTAPLPDDLRRVAFDLGLDVRSLDPNF
jgi:23S rRNA pseudouridine1911/1915/1917 synthase